MSNRTGAVCLLVFLLTATALAGPQPGRSAATSARAEALLPLERQVREQFPTVALDSQATLEPAQELVSGQMVSGMRARPLRSAPSTQLPMQPLALVLPPDGDGGGVRALRVFYPASYNQAFVVELGEQRVALRPIGAHFAQATPSAGKLFYTSPHDSVDVIEVPSTGRSEELLLLHDTRAPRVFEYEIVEMRGVAGLSLQEGAIRFAPNHLAVPTTSEIVSGRFTAPQPSLQIDRPWVIDANGKRSESAARWTVVEEEGQLRRIRLTIRSERLAYPLVVDPSFSTTGSLGAARESHTATLLPNGKVLITGGNNGSGNLSTAELYDPATGAFTAIGTMNETRAGHTATLLPNGKVLIAGGISAQALQTAELYNPVTNTFTVTGSMTGARASHTATLLPNGKVLVAGGTAGLTVLNTTEVYDNGTFTASGNLASTRQNHTSTLLPSGKVLIAGGTDGNVSLNATELYDPLSGGCIAIVNMTAARSHHSATLLPNGRVLITGGASTLFGTSLSTAELYDPTAAANGTFTAVVSNMAAGRQSHSATLLPSGKVLLAGGAGNGLSSAPLSTADLYDPVVNTFSATATLAAARWNHTATLIPNGRVLIAGGENPTALNTAELYDSAGGTFTTTSGPMAVTRQNHTSTLLPNGKVLITGSSSVVPSADLYDPGAGTFAAASAPIAPRQSHTATLLSNGKVLIAGGQNLAVAVNTAELYDPAVGTFTAITPRMTSVRYFHTATLLPDGKVLIAGGTNGPSFLLTAELYDPAGGTFTPTNGPMSTGRFLHTATLLPNGTVLLAGGGPGASTNLAELYDPASGTFSPTGNMPVGRYGHTATLLPNGMVLIAGGANGAGFSSTESSPELYDPASGVFTPTSGAMISPRHTHTATLLPTGTVLIAGGSNGVAAVSSAELYDPARGTFTATSVPMNVPRDTHTATLMLNGNVLIAGGTSNGPPVSSAEVYDAGLGSSATRRPLVSTLTNLLCQPGNLSLGGSLFTGDSEGSSGSTSSSPSNAPLLRLQRVSNDQFLFAMPQIFSPSSFFSTTLNNLPSGLYRAAIVSNAIPSVEQIIQVATTPLLGTYGPASVNLAGNSSNIPSLLPAGYNGAFYPLAASASAGFTGTLGINGSNGVVSVTNAGPPGTFTITVSSATSCGSPTTTFILDVLGPPASLTATGGTPQNAPVDGQFAPLQVTVRDSAGHLLNNVAVIFTAPASGASATLSSGSALTNASGVASVTATPTLVFGSYNVTAVLGALTATFALANRVPIPENMTASANGKTSVVVSWLSWAALGASYEVQRQSAGGVFVTFGPVSPGQFIDTTVLENTAYLYRVRAIAPDITPYAGPDLATTTIPSFVTGIVQAVHFTELRTAANAVRSLAGLTAFPFTDATLTPGLTTVKAVHLTELRAALNAARSSLALPPIIYARPTITPGTSVISLIDIGELRVGVR